MRQAGLGQYSSSAWPVLSKPVGRERFDERLGWMTTLLTVDTSRPGSAVEDYKFLTEHLRPGDQVDAVIQDWLPFRQRFESWNAASAQEAFLMGAITSTRRCPEPSRPPTSAR